MAASDEKYIINLCDDILGEKAKRQHRFDFLLGDANHAGKQRKLPVDAFYESKKLVIEYYERQHTEAVPHFDKRITVSGISRGEQRRRYDQRREIALSQHGICLVKFSYDQFPHKSNKRLLRVKDEDIIVIKTHLKNYLV